jgi:hypothetical protein
MRLFLLLLIAVLLSGSSVLGDPKSYGDFPRWFQKFLGKMEGAVDEADFNSLIQKAQGIDNEDDLRELLRENVHMMNERGGERGRKRPDRDRPDRPDFPGRDRRGRDRDPRRDPRDRDFMDRDPEEMRARQQEKREKFMTDTTAMVAKAREEGVDISDLQDEIDAWMAAKDRDMDALEKFKIARAVRAPLVKKGVKPPRPGRVRGDKRPNRDNFRPPRPL